MTPAMGLAVPRPFRWRFTRCERCGSDLDIRIDNATNVAETLTAGTDRPHRHDPAVVVTFDQDALAEAIVAASRAARKERQTAQTTVQTPTQTVFADSEPPTGRGDINGVEVVRPEQ